MSLGIRNYGLDFMKFVAALMITNSHFQPLYKDVNEGLATFGVHGNALFFFVAGFLLMAGFKNRKMSFSNWYKRRVQRLWPAVFLWAILSSICFGSLITWQKCVLFLGYWFLQCIAIYYALYYVTCYMFCFRRLGGALFLYVISIIISIIVALLLPKSQGSLFHSDWHFFCHFSAMVLGGICYDSASDKKYRKTDWLICFVSFLAYFVVLKLGKGKTDLLYYTQILGLIPLHLFLWYFFKICNRNWTARLFGTKICGTLLKAISALTLEIYIVQFHIISDRWNSVFGLNLLIVFTEICLCAYLLRIATNIFIQFMSKEDWNIKQIVKLY